ncbi:Gfo/Idh/MocA family protein [Halomontanus rarus]|uniref:Gfo/Idh/MocA family protein n=1 Tax=Halomontanus rarus TaxID=3034020 RepID=UPI0023E79457|nr:Gfo/Idh/MocA family oxidoreductase [Halovivax sp. TS33]
MALQLAAIGLGGLGRIQSDVCTDIDGVELVAGADIAPESSESFETEFGVPAYENYRELLAEHADELDAVNIVTPHTLHFEQAMDCLDAGLHVHLEKPMVTTTADALELTDHARERNLLLQIGYQRHFHPAYREIKRLLENGRIGDVHMVAAHLAQDWIRNVGGTWRTNPELSGGGQLIDSGSHLLDVVLWATDSQPRSVAALTDNWEQAVDVNSALSVELESDQRRITASIGISGDGDSFEEQLSFWGTEGRLAYEDGELLVVENGTRYVTEFEDPDYAKLTGDKLGAFVEAVQNGNPSPVPGEFGLRVTRLTEAAFLSSETGAVIDAASLPRTGAEPTVADVPEADL